jgi:N-acetylglucosamine-6-phosphate deacetylase
MKFALRGARLIDAENEVASGNITIEGTRICSVGETDSSADVLIDARDMIVTPGFIDVHVHGGGGFNLHTTDRSEIQSYMRWVPQTGVTSFLIAVVGVPHTLPEAQLETAVAAIEDQGVGAGAEAVGIHLEGPYLNVKRRGAHPPNWLRTPNAPETERVLALTRGHLRLVTLAPELPGGSEMIRRLVEAGVTVSMGHTDATYEQAWEAIHLGVTHVTHCFNAMRPINHHNPGVLEAAAEAPQVRGELIADGIHVHPAVMKVAVKMLSPERLVVVTDAQAGAGIPDAVFEFAGQAARVQNGAAYLMDGGLAGSVLTLDQALRNMQQMANLSLQDAIRTLSWNPALAAHVQDRKGRLLPRYDADLLVFDQALNLQATICRGKVSFATETWQARLSEVGEEEGKRINKI